MTYIEELFSLKGRTAIISGGYGHLGRSMCWALAAAGAKVYCAGPSREHFRESFPFTIMEAVARENPDWALADIRYLPFDLASEQSHAEVLQQVQNQSGGLDILVNSAFFLSSNADKAIARNFSKDMDGILNNTAIFSELAQDMLQRSDQARIVNIASMYGMVAPKPELYCEYPEQRSRASYGAAKAALIQLTRYWASFWGTSQFTVNAISPGPFPRTYNCDELFLKKLSDGTIAGRIGRPEDLVGALLLLCSRAGSYITGQNIIVDGGWTVR